MAEQTDFGFSKVHSRDKAAKVAGVFNSVADRYDVMNDVMSLGLHRIWKHLAVFCADLREGMQVLDVAGGTADLAMAMAKRVGDQGQVVLTDINVAMLARGRDRLIDAGLHAPAVQCDAESLPFPDHCFDRVTVAFGLRNMTHKDQALAEMRRVLCPGGKLMILEFSRVHPALEKLYELYSFQVLPRLGRLIAGDEASYRYLAESIRMHPDQESLARMLREAGFQAVRYTNLTGGVVALHEGVKP
ncbi:MAG: bifunctional demethylmenaquinone methyltransferase/2-methoxy-6-polyprenyl-1,4-benzoquinol methylase UbiE [Betaproteobacteria bacterium]|nr:bifunctional demethylmenaquinone methyltransferase/2-methoxy-6-polyprenyl-1,4-benzoquinol methylase UbiE [Pseudomonadota bacterium]NBO12029.1 bifunctional demethylmenaquinone methyltransferase/2-methoxy-6-polyprenyl-1,4-benzoquinol methylase UbiE [Betaproteobacteria bacterium]NBO44874.1 bifunctional demethylmenaquinone methyltransferase/2-methoxy-6-polyprenyl-1,4-benzoquinol methylase UbiE [Betaproteobacteria bacterium]NBP10724.1 bifunctional demethylmenaquinone methyltransferase/2-methoxy-6-